MKNGAMVQWLNEGDNSIEFPSLEGIGVGKKI
jgi:hypothetical protein